MFEVIAAKALTKVMNKDGTKILEIIICEKRQRMTDKVPEILILFKRKVRGVD